ncbi:uncharacterized protein LOC6525393 [Drosophila yakuba]|uniref:Putative ionotropic receptor ligand binding domain-containing protein n=1 Tax=Drosophila yakuba TaxID=7245 RepID=A0A0R1EBI6_DROYA|nr:uncharacterized protein LOC6525393 [Drosophila yakuba]KRK06717.1 uncharacterized protein Dyak_GE17504 [Drosophila yakuba]
MNTSSDSNPSSSLSYSIYSSYVEHSRIDMQGEEANLYVARALRLVIENVLAQLSTTLVVAISTRHLGTAHWFEYMMNSLMDSWRMVAVQLIRIRPDLVANPVVGRKRVSLLMVDSYQGLLDTNITANNADFDDPDYYFIFLQARDHLIPKQLQLILDHCLAHFWLHCNVMIQTAQVEVLVYTYYPYTANACQAAHPIPVNTFDGRQWKVAQMFPDKLSQMHGCPLTVLTWPQPPFVELHWDPQRNRSRGSGFEIQLVEQLARRMNFSLELVNMALLRPDAYRLAEGSSEGPIERLLQRSVNISMGYFRSTARRNQLLTTPMSYYSANLVAVLQLERYRIGSLALLVFPFQLSVWMLLLLALLIHLGIHLPCGRRRGNGVGGGGLQVVALLLGAALARLPRPWRHRFIAAHWLWASIPLRISYQSLLFHLIRLQLYSTPSFSLDQLLAEGFQGICTANTQRLLLEMPQVARDPDSFQSLDTPSDWDVLNVLTRNRNRKIFAVANQDVTISFLHSSAHPNAFHVVKQPVNVEYTGMYMPKHSFLYEKLDDDIRRLDASGFIHAWRRASFATVHRMEQQVRLTSRRYINHAKLSGIYVVMAGLYLLAGLVFAGELLLERRVRN